MYCPQHLLRVPTLHCRNNIVHFLCCLKIKFAHELYWQTTKQCPSHKIVLISLQAMFNYALMNEICQFVGRSHVGLGDCAVCLPDYRSGRLRSRRFWWFKRILDVCCPASSPLYCLSQFFWLDNQQLDVSTFYLEILLSSALSLNLYEFADYRSDYGLQHSKSC